MPTLLVIRIPAIRQRINILKRYALDKVTHLTIPGEPVFLKAMIELFRQNHHCSVADIRALFESFSKDYVCEKMPEGSDFDEVLYFKDTSVDSYYYCVKEEMGHTIYHRFTKEDMENLW